MNNDVIHLIMNAWYHTLLYYDLPKHGGSAHSKWSPWPYSRGEAFWKPKARILRMYFRTTWVPTFSCLHFFQFQKKYRIRNVEPTPLIQQVGRESDKFYCRWGSCYGYAPIIGPVHVLPSCHKLRGIAVVFSLQLYSWFQGAWLPRFSVGTKCANRKFECICASNSSIDRNQARANELEWLPHTTHRLCTRICIYIYIYIHTYIHIHIHIYERLWKP